MLQNIGLESSAPTETYEGYEGREGTSFGLGGGGATIIAPHCGEAKGSEKKGIPGQRRGRTPRDSERTVEGRLRA